jgi:hypothetical protein
MSLSLCAPKRDSGNQVDKQTLDVAGNMKKQLAVFQPEYGDAALNPNSRGWFCMSGIAFAFKRF